MQDLYLSQRKIRRFLKFAQRLLRLVLLAVEIIERLRNLIQ